MIRDYIWILLLFFGITVLFFILIKELLTQRALRAKLNRGRKLESSAQALKKLDKLEALAKVIRKILPPLLPMEREKLVCLLEMSGSTYSLEKFLIVRFLSMIFSAVVGLWLGGSLDDWLKQAAIVTVFGSLGFLAPYLALKHKADLRQKAISRALPSFIDYLTIMVDSGLSLDLALTRLVDYLKGPLREEMALTLMQIKYGKSKKEAFKNMAQRVNLPEFSFLINTLITREQLGISLSPLLRAQGYQLRLFRKQRAREAAYKIPVKLLFPLILFIFPQLFIILLGPAMINLFNNLF